MTFALGLSSARSPDTSDDDLSSLCLNSLKIKRVWLCDLHAAFET